MRRARPIVMALGVLAVLMGALWIAQGLGYVNWPRSSFMLGEPQWATYGGALAVAGLLLILVAGRAR